MPKIKQKNKDLNYLVYKLSIFSAVLLVFTTFGYFYFSAQTYVHPKLEDCFLGGQNGGVIAEADLACLTRNDKVEQSYWQGVFMPFKALSVLLIVVLAMNVLIANRSLKIHATKSK